MCGPTRTRRSSLLLPSPQFLESNLEGTLSENEPFHESVPGASPKPEEATAGEDQAEIGIAPFGEGTFKFFPLPNEDLIIKKEKTVSEPKQDKLIRTGYNNKTTKEEGENTLVTTAAISATAAKMNQSLAANERVSKRGRTTADPERTKSGRKKRRRKPQKPGKTANMNERHFVQHNYHDHAQDTDDAVDSEDNSHHHYQDSSSTLKNRGGVAVAFPLKLHDMLSHVEQAGHVDIVSWSPHGRAFAIHDPRRFVSQIMPMFFRQSKITSFQRQLNLYGFVRLTRGLDSGAYYHELFLRGKRGLVNRMTRTKVKGVGFKAASSPDQEPNFYLLPYVNVSAPQDNQEVLPTSTPKCVSPVSSEQLEPTPKKRSRATVGTTNQNRPEKMLKTASGGALKETCETYEDFGWVPSCHSSVGSSLDSTLCAGPPPPNKKTLVGSVKREEPATVPIDLFQSQQLMNILPSKHSNGIPTSIETYSFGVQPTPTFSVRLDEPVYNTNQMESYAIPMTFSSSMIHDGQDPEVPRPVVPDLVSYPSMPFAGTVAADQVLSVSSLTPNTRANDNNNASSSVSSLSSASESQELAEECGSIEATKEFLASGDAQDRDVLTNFTQYWDDSCVPSLSATSDNSSSLKTPRSARSSFSMTMDNFNNDDDSLGLLAASANDNDDDDDSFNRMIENLMKDV